MEGQFKGPSVLGVAVCWTGQGKIAIIPILKEDSEKSEVIDASDFHGLPGECTRVKGMMTHGTVYRKHRW